MAQIPNDTRFIGINPTVNLRERRSARINRETQPHTMQDIADSVLPYKAFTAIVRAWDNDPPIVVELENAIGPMDFTKLDSGVYAISSDSLFTADKTVIFYGSLGNMDDYAPAPELIVEWQSASSIRLFTFSEGVASNFIIWQMPIEIRVYN